MRGVFLFLVFLLGSLVAAEARCYVTPCRLTVNRAFGTSELHAIRIVEKPRHGVVTLTGFSMLYRARPGFKGEDAFVFMLIGQDAGKPTKGRTRVRVTVQ